MGYPTDMTSFLSLLFSPDYILNFCTDCLPLPAVPGHVPVFFGIRSSEVELPGSTEYGVLRTGILWRIGDGDPDDHTPWISHDSKGHMPLPIHIIVWVVLRLSKVHCL